jgi:WD40 repeat protein
MASRLTVLYGESGVGKSSVLRAGVAHHLRGVAAANLVARNEPGMAIVVFDAWRDDPAHALRLAVADAVTQALGGSLQPPDEDMPLVDALRLWTSVLDGDIYVVLDQAEEYFLYHPADDDPNGFAAQFSAAVNTPDLPANFLLAIREDALAKLDAFKARIPNVLGNYLRLEHLDPSAARTAIVEPIRAYNSLVEDDQAVEIEPGLVDAVLEQVVAGKVEVGQAGRGSTPDGEATARIETAYLQLVMYRLWDAELSTGSHVLRLETLSRLGGAEQIVRDHVEEALTGLTAEEKDLAARMLDHLVTPSGAKIAHEVVDLARYADASETDVLPVLVTLGNERILRSVSGNGRRGTGYEIYHDVLAEPVLAWKAGHESQREREREAVETERRHRRLVRLLAAAVVALVLMAGVTVFAVAEWNKARSQARLAHGRELTGKALAALNVDPLESMALALESAKLRRTSEAEAILRQALAANRERAILPSDGPVRTVAYNRDGSLVLTASGDGTARLWLPDGTLVHTLASGGPLAGASFSPDGSLVVSASADHTARIWRTATGMPVAILRHGSAVNSASFDGSGSRVVTASTDRTVRVWSAPEGKPLLVIHLAATPTSAAFGQNGRLILETSAAHPGGAARARLFDATTGRLVRAFPVGGVTVAKFSPNGLAVLTGLADGTTDLWRVRDGGLIHTLSPARGSGRVTDAAFSLNGGLLATSYSNGVTRLWFPVSGAPWIRVLHPGAVTHVSFSRDAKLLLTAGTDGTARIWLARNGGSVAVLRGPRDSVVADAVFSPDGTAVATAGRDGAARLWDAADLSPLWVGTARVWTASFAPAGRRVVIGGDAPFARILSDDGRILRELAQPAPVHGAVFTPDGSLVLTADANGVLRVWNVSTGALVHRADNVTTGPLALSNDGRYLTAPTMQGAIGIWSVATLRLLRVIGQGGHFNASAFSPDGHLVGGAGRSGIAVLFDAASGAVVNTLRGHTKGVTGIAFSSDGRLVVTSSLDDDARIWDVATGHVTEILNGSYGPLSAASFSPNGRWVVTAGPASAGIWDVSTGDSIIFLRGHTGPLTAASFSPDGTRVLTAGLDGTVRLYTCEACGNFDQLVGAAAARMDALANRLTPAQRARFLPASGGS